MKKILSLLLSLLLLFTLISCVDSGEQEAMQTVQNFLDKLIVLDIEGAKAYVDHPDELDDIFEGISKDTLFQAVPAEFQKYADDFNTIIDSMLNKCASVMTYNIKDTYKEDGCFIYVVDMTYPNMDFDFEDAFEQSFTEEVMMGIATELLSSGKITTTSTQEEIYDALMPKVFQKAQEVINEMELKTKMESIEIAVIEKDGKWLISAEESDL